MTQRGIIQGGAIVLEQPVDLPEGARVEVEIVAVSRVEGGVARGKAITELSKDIGYDAGALGELRRASLL